MISTTTKLKQPDDDSNTEKSKNCRLEHNQLLCIFTEYFWDETNGSYPGCKDTELDHWLTMKRLNLNDKFWYLSSKIDVRMAIINDLKSNENIRNVEDSKKNKTCAQLAYTMRKILPFLTANNNVNTDGQTILHIFIEEYLKMTKYFNTEQISRLTQLIEALAKSAVSFLVSDKAGKTPLHLAIECKSQKIVKIIVNYLIDVNARDVYGNSPMHIIIDNCIDEDANHTNGYVNMVKTLILKNADINTKNDKGITPLQLAVEKFHVPILKLLIKSDADCQLQDGSNLVHVACKSTVRLKNFSRMTKTSDFLISCGCDAEAYDKDGYTPLHYAADLGSTDLVKKLISYKIYIDCRTKHTLVTPLYLSAKSDHLDIIKLLIEAGADINAEAFDGSTPIFMTVMLGKYESLQFLIDHGADLYRREKDAGFTLLHLAAYDPDFQNQHDRSEDRIKQKSRKLNAFIGKDFDINDTATVGITPLHLATLTHNVENVKILINNGANVNYQSDRYELTTLHLAVISGHYEIVKILIENNADIKCKGGVEQMSLLHFAVAFKIDWELGKYPIDAKSYKNLSLIHKYWPRGKITQYSMNKVLTLLLKSGAEVNAKDNLGRTPLNLASVKSYTSIIKELLESGAHVNVQDGEGKLPICNVVEKGNVEAFKLMLNFGADINDPDVSEMIINSRVEIKNVALQHAIKLKLLGLPVAEVYNPLIKSPEFTEFHDQCFEELESLADYSNAGVSLYRFLRMNAKLQYIHIEKFASFLENIEQVFPVYSGLVRGACRESAYRKLLLQLARITWNKISTVRFPKVCIETIFEHFTNRYLEVFVVNFDDSEKVIVEKGDRRVLFGSSEYTT